jgi:hypothetical protein
MPSWGIIDRFMPTATSEEQEAAYENLVSLSKLLVRIDDRLFEEEQELKRTIQPPLFR